MSVSRTSVRVLMICGALYGMLIAAIQLRLILSGEHSMILLYWLLMPTLWIMEKLPSGVLERPPLFAIAGINALFFFSVILGAIKAVGWIKGKAPNQPPEPTRSVRGSS